MQDTTDSQGIYDIPIARIITDSEWAALEESFEREMNL